MEARKMNTNTNMKRRAIRTRTDLEDELQEVILGLVDELVVERSAAKVEIHPLGPMTNFHIHVAPIDMRRVIGGKGAVIRGLTNLVRLIGRRYKQRFDLKLIDPPIQARDSDQKFVGQHNWNQSHVRALAQRLADLIFTGAVVEIIDGENFDSALEFQVPETTKQEIIALVSPDLTALFDAIGKPNGRHIIVAVSTPEETLTPSF